jgi:hypothetical protein
MLRYPLNQIVRSGSVSHPSKRSGWKPEVDLAASPGMYKIVSYPLNPSGRSICGLLGKRS